MKIEYNQPETKSKDLTAENIEQLKKLFPNIVEEGKVNFDVLRQLLGDEVVAEQEYYRFTWPGKHQARQEALKTSTGTLRPAKEESVDWDNTQNLYIEGDNLEVLKLLQKSYFNKVKMIYIDPPYNTGKDFVYKDNYKDNLVEYNQKFNRADAEGNVFSSETNNEGNARYHSNWLNMMYPRLQLARTLLKDDGVIFISIDDNEVHNLRRICDEIFGEENFIGEIIWETATDNNATQIAIEHEYILCYAKKLETQHKWIKTSEKAKIITSKYNELKNKFQNIEEIQDNLRAWINANKKSNKVDLSGVSHYNYIDEKGVYYPGNPANTYLGNYTYDILHPITKKVCEKPANGYRWPRETFEKASKNGEVLWGDDETIIPKIKKRIETATELFKSYYYEDNRRSNILLQNLFGRKIFDNPKSINLIKKLVFFALEYNENSVILDFFSGSATTAHAVMDLNKEDLLEGNSSTSSEQVPNRKYIMVQLPEPTEEKSEAFKAGYKTIAEIGKERIRRAANQIKEELKDKSEVLQKLDLGFKVFKLDSSNIHSWDTAPEALENNLFREEVIKENRSAEDVLYEVLLKYGQDLNLKVEEVILDGKKIYSIGAGQVLFCLDNGITRDTAQAIIDWAKEEEMIDPKIVFKDSGFTNDVEKTNIIQLFKTHGVTDVKSV